QPPDLVPGDGGDLNHDLAHRGRLHTLERVQEVVPLDADALQDLARHLGPVQIDEWKVPAQRLDRGLSGQGREVRSDETVGGSGEFLHIDVFGERHSARVDRQYLVTALLVGNSDDDLPIEPAGAPQGLVDRVDT